MTRYEIANIGGIVLGSAALLACIYLTIFAERVARQYAENASREFGKTMARQYTATNIRIASVPGMGLGVFMIVSGILGRLL